MENQLILPNSSPETRLARSFKAAKKLPVPVHSFLFLAMPTQLQQNLRGTLIREQRQSAYLVIKSSWVLNPGLFSSKQCILKTEKSLSFNSFLLCMVRAFLYVQFILMVSYKFHSSCDRSSIAILLSTKIISTEAIVGLLEQNNLYFVHTKSFFSLFDTSQRLESF